MIESRLQSARFYMLHKSKSQFMLIQRKPIVKAKPAAPIPAGASAHK